MSCIRKIFLDVPLLAGCSALVILQIAYLLLLPSYPSAMSLFVVRPGVSVGPEHYLVTLWSLTFTFLGLYGIITSDKQLVWWFCLSTLLTGVVLFASRLSMGENPHKITQQELAKALKKDLGALATTDGLLKLKDRLGSAINETKTTIDDQSVGNLLGAPVKSILTTCCGIEHESRALCDWQDSPAAAKCRLFYSRAFTWNKLGFYIYEVLALLVFVVSLIFVLVTPKADQEVSQCEEDHQDSEAIQLAAASAPPLDTRGRLPVAAGRV